MNFMEFLEPFHVRATSQIKRQARFGLGRGGQRRHKVTTSKIPIRLFPQVNQESQHVYLR